MTGTFRRNTEPHQKCSSKRPPRTGPIAPPAEKLAIQTPTANVRSRASRNMLRMSESVDGASVAAATPSRARAPIRISALHDRAASTEAAPNAAAPINSSLRRPIRSPRVPIVISDPATRKP